jgi:hypothetical protein
MTYIVGKGKKGKKRKERKISFLLLKATMADQTKTYNNVVYVF